MFRAAEDLPSATVTSPARSGIITAMTDTPAETPPAFNGNPTPARQTADGVAAIAEMIAQMPQANAQALAMVLQQVQVQTRPPLCAHCASARLAWQAAHERELAAAASAAAAAAGLAEGDPRAAQLDPAPFLPENLRPGGSQGIPPMHRSITAVGGTEVCSEHIPGRPGSQKLVIATGALSPSALAGLG